MQYLTVESTKPVSIFRWVRIYEAGGWLLYHHTSSSDKDGRLICAASNFDEMDVKVKSIISGDIGRWWVGKAAKEIAMIKSRNRVGIRMDGINQKEVVS